MYKVLFVQQERMSYKFFEECQRIYTENVQLMLNIYCIVGPLELIWTPVRVIYSHRIGS